MKHSIEELFAVVFRYYPRGIARSDPRYEASEEYARLVASRREAGAKPTRDPWYGLLRTLGERFPDHNVGDNSAHLPTGQFDACYTGYIELPAAPGERWHSLYFLVSFLTPVYVVYSERHVEQPARGEADRTSRPATVGVFVGDTMHIVPREVVTDEVRAEADRRAAEIRARPRVVYSLEHSPDELPVVDVLSAEIEAVFRCERMPPDVGRIVVPDVATSERGFGAAKLYDCLLSDREDWSAKLGP